MSALYAANLRPCCIPFWKTDAETARESLAECAYMRELAEEVSELLTSACDSLPSDNTLSDLFADADTLRATLEDAPGESCIRDDLDALCTAIEEATARRAADNKAFVDEIDKADKFLRRMIDGQ